MKILFSILILSVSSLSFGMDAKEVIAQMQKVYKNTSVFEYSCTYNLYKGHKSTVVADSYSGYTCRTKAGYYQKIDQSEFVYANDFFLKVSHHEKAMALSLPQKNVQLTADFDQAMKNCSEIKLEETADYYQVVLLIKNTSEIPYSVIKLRISKSKFHLLRMDLYYTSVQDFAEPGKQPDLEKPHLQIVFGTFDSKPKIKSSLFSLETYLKNTNNLLVPVGACQGYDLIDNRIK